MKKIFFSVLILYLFLNMGNFLDLTSEPKKADIIVVLGGSYKARIEKGLEYYTKNYSKSNKIIYTGLDLHGGNEFPLYSFKKYLIDNNVKSEDIIQIKEVTNTMEELIKVKNYLIRNNLRSVLFVTHPTHTRRIKLLANNIAHYKDMDISLSFVAADDTKAWNKNLFFLNYTSFKLVFLETLKIFYNIIKYKLFISVPISEKSKI